jgi:hypothetical protein
MAEFKNVFIKSKMNKDLDDRLLPQGEYRNALNIQVSKSESSDVGALENVLGNSELINFKEIIPGKPDVVCIGYLVSEVNSCVFFFLTNNTIASNPNGRYNNNPLTKHYVVRSIISQGSATQSNILVEGLFLNFWEGAPIYGVNLLEQLLFWTDNRNQPRKINVDSALNDAGYYIIEDTISVAKYMPYTAPILWDESKLSPGNYETTMKDVASKEYPNGGIASTNGAVTSATVFAIDNVSGYVLPGSKVTGTGITAGTTVVSYTAPNLTVSSAQTLADNVELVFNANPYYDNTYRGDPDYLEDKFARFSYRFKFDDGEYSLFAPFTQECFIPKQDGYFLSDPEATTTDENDMSASYRSTIVDFMENKVNELTLLIEMPKCGDPALDPTSLSNVASQFKITEVEILYKESDGAAVMVVDTIKFGNQFEKTTSSNTLSYVYSGTKPFRTLPEDQLTRVYDKVPVKALGQEVISNRVVYSNFQTKHTPPTTLNYNVGTQPKQDFNVSPTNPTQWRTSMVEYPNHTLKQNRNYQAGFVLSDRFGRTTSTLLSNSGDGAVGTVNKLSTVYSPYNEGDGVVNIGRWPGDSLFVQVNETINEVPVAPTLYPGTYVGDPTLRNYNPLGFETWKVVVKQQEQDYYNVYLPGILAAYPEDQNQELGLTSHVVLLNDNINKVPRDLAEVGPDQKQFRSSVQLFGRVQNTATASMPTVNDIRIVNEQYYPSRFSDTVSTISNLFDMFNLQGSNYNTDYDDDFYEAESNPLIGRISTTNQIGQVTPPNPGNYSIFNLAVYETEPVESKLDIYWETSTSGTIKDLNAQVIETGGQTIFEMVNFDWYLSEYFGVLDTTVAWDPATLGSPEPGGNPTTTGPAADGVNGYSGRFRSVIGGIDSTAGSENGAFYFKDFSGTPLQSITLVDFVVTDGFGVDVTNDFDVLKIDGTANGGPGYYTNYRNLPSTQTPATYDSFILVNKKHRVFLTSNGLANDFSITMRFEDATNPGPIKTFQFPGDNQIDETSLENLQTIHVGGEQLITPFVTWGQTSLPIEDFTLDTPNLPGCTTSLCPGLFYEYGYEEGLTAPVDLVKFYGMNGANYKDNGGLSTTQPNQETLQWSIVFEQQPFTGDNNPSNTTPTIFEINENTGVLREIEAGVGFGLYFLRILVQSNDGSPLPAYFDIKITIGRKTADGSFDNNLRGDTGIELQYDNSYIFNLHNTLGQPGNFGAYDDLPGGIAGSIETTFKRVYPNINGIYNQTPAPTLNENYRNASNGSYDYGPFNANFQKLTILQPSGFGYSEGALTQGTGYINIEMILAGLGTGGPGNPELYQTSQVSWAVEYREVVGGVITSGWKAATDIEGNILSWNSSLAGSTRINPQQSGLRIDGAGGGTQGSSQTSLATHNAARPSDTSGQDERQNYGAGNIEFNDLQPNSNPANTVQYKAQISSNSQSQTTALIGKWVVVGESPIYGNTIAPPCFGEYRVIIQNIGGECDTCQSKIVGSNPSFPNQDANDGRSSADAGRINIGDFYYDLKPLNAPRAYGYYVDLNTYDNDAQGLEDALDNNMFNPLKSSVEILYAEEGVNRYVSQFYVDAGLTQVVTNATFPKAWDNGASSGPRYVSYTAVETGSSNYNVPYSVNVPDLNNPPPPEEAQTPNLAAENAAAYNANSGSEQYKRLWACKIDTSTGRKEAKSSVGRP